MARNRDTGDVEVGGITEKEFKSFLKKLDLAQGKVGEATAEAKTARSELSAIWKAFKKAGGKPDTMREVMALRNMEDGDRIQHEADRVAYAKFMKLPLGAQPDMFEDEIEQSAAPEAPPVPLPLAYPPKRGRRANEPANETGSPLN